MSIPRAPRGSAPILALALAVVGGACVCFVPGHPIGMDIDARGRLGQTAVLQGIGLRHVDDTSGVAVRVLSSPQPQYGLVVMESGQVRYFGGLGVVCAGALQRDVGRDSVQRILNGLRTKQLPESRYKLSPTKPSDSAEVRLGFRAADGEWRESVFHDALDEPELIEALGFVLRSTGVRNLIRSLEAPDSPRSAQNCSYRPFMF